MVSYPPFLSFYTGSRFLALPWTDTASLARYCPLNNADVLQLQTLHESAPFWEDVDSATWNDNFELAYQGKDAYGRPVRVYRLKLPEGGGSSESRLDLE